ARGGDHRSAAPLYEKVHSFHDAAQCYRALGDSASEARAQERAKAPLGAADAWIAAGKPGEAIRILGSVERDSPERRTAQGRRGALLAHAGRDREAAESLREALEGAAVDPTTAPWFALNAEVLRRVGEIDAAIASLNALRGTSFAPAD